MQYGAVSINVDKLKIVLCWRRDKGVLVSAGVRDGAVEEPPGGRNLGEWGSGCGICSFVHKG